MGSIYSLPLTAINRASELIRADGNPEAGASMQAEATPFIAVLTRCYRQLIQMNSAYRVHMRRPLLMVSLLDLSILHISVACLARDSFAKESLPVPF